MSEPREPTGMGWARCRRTDCNTFPTYVVFIPLGVEEYWVCGRHVTWAMEWLAKEKNNWTVSVRYNAWHKAVTS